MDLSQETIHFALAAAMFVFFTFVFSFRVLFYAGEGSSADDSSGAMFKKTKEQTKERREKEMEEQTKRNKRWNEQTKEVT